MKKIVLLLLSPGLVAFSCKKDYSSPVNDPGKKFYRRDEFNMGVDLSYINQVKDYGGVYRDAGKAIDCFQILKDHDANTVRVRLWHTPTWVGNKTNKSMCWHYKF